MKTLKVSDMHCEMCVKRITTALTSEGINLTISLENKTVSVDDTAVLKAVAILDDLGFTVDNV
jgi:copper chaperone